MPIIIKNRKFKWFNQSDIDFIVQSGIDAAPIDISKVLNIDPRRIIEIQQWLDLKSESNFTKEQEEYIRAHPWDKAKDISSVLNINKDKISMYILKYDLRKGSNRIPHKIDRNRVVEYENDLKDFMKTHAELGLKWNCTGEAIGAARKTRGLGVKRKNYGTIPEQKVAQLLNQLDITYTSQKRITKWSLDFYLGHHICLDVNGTWVHSKEHIKEKDQRKTHDLNALGYFYLCILENELTDETQAKKKIESFYWASLKSNLKKNNFVNPIIQGCSSNEELTVNSREDNTVPSLASSGFEGVETNCRLEDELPVEARNP